MIEVEKCGGCGKSIDESHLYSRCDECDEPLTEAAKQRLLKWPSPGARAGSPALNRYRDALHEAAGLVGLGRRVSLVGLSLTGSLILGVSSLSTEPQALSIGTALTAALLCGLFWASGVLITGIGRVTAALLHHSVAHSPFLTDTERLAALRLPRAVETGSKTDASAI